MNERVKAAKVKVTEFWQKYTRKQKALMFSIIGVVILALILLAVIINKPQWKTLIECSDTTTAASVAELLDSEGIEYKATNSTTFQVKKEDLTKAQWALGSNSIPASGYSINDALDGGFSATESDKNKKYKAYLEDKMRTVIESVSYVRTATVNLNIPETKLSVLNSDEETSAAVMLDLKGKVPDGGGRAIAQFVATSVGNDTLEHIVVMDSEGNMLFVGEEEAAANANGSMGLTSQQKMREYAESKIIENIRKLFLGTNDTYDTIDVSPNIDMNFDSSSRTEHTYSVPEGQEQGPYTSSYEVEQSGSSGVGGIPGTDSNDEDLTTYELTESDGSTSSYSMKKYDYAVNEVVETTTGAMGKINLDASSVSIILTKYINYNEEDMTAEELGELSWDEFKRANSDRTELELNADDVEFVAAATGIASDNIRIRAYQVPIFMDAQRESRSVMDYLQIILAVIIFGLLGFVVWRSTRPVEVTELEPELSVDALLSTTMEQKEEVEDIDLNDKSEIRKAIEKFVDENPEAVASLLRNWLNEGWE